MVKRLCKIVLMVALVSGLLTGYAADSAYASNLVDNPGFESGLWAERSTGFAIDTGVYHSGNQSVKIAGTSTRKSIISAPVPVNPYEGYQLDVWVRSNLADSSPAITVSLLPCTATNQPLPWYPGGQEKLIQAGGGRQNWTRYTATITDLPAAAATVKIYLRVEAGASGEVWFDDVSLKSINLAPDGGFEAGLWSNNNGFVRDSAQTHSGSYSAKATGQSARNTLYTGLIPIQPSERYKLILWVRTESISSADGFSVSVLQVDGSNQAVGWYGGAVKLAATGGTQGWTRLETDLSSFATGTANLRVYLRTDEGITGTVWVDDVRLNKIHRDGFLWGINGHGKSAAAYKPAQLGNQLQKGADLGVSYYRINVNPDIVNGSYDWTYMDQVVDTAYNKALKLYLVLYSSLSLEPAVLQQRGQDIAARYKGKIDYYQLGNEVDLDCILGAQYDGSKTAHYDPVKYTEARNKLNALGIGIRLGDPHAQRVVNISYKHTAFLEMLNADGVVWEVNGLDWYSNMGSITGTLNKLQSYPQSEILIAECNTFYGTQTRTEQEQADYIAGMANQIYYEAPSKVKGFIVYELLDEPAFSSGEGYYGLVHSSEGIIGTEKLAYGVYREAIINKQRD